MNKFHKTSGETIAESIIALSVLAIGITFSGVLIASALQNVQGSRERVIATSIAREAIEAIRNVRDTNWLRYSSDPRNCWNMLPSENPAAACDINQRISAGDYYVYLDANYQWRLEPSSGGADPNRLLYLVDVDPAMDTSGDLVNDNDEDLFNHQITGNTINSLGYSNAQTTRFSRTITLNYLANGQTSPSGNQNDNRLQVQVTVEWDERGKKQLVLSTLLTDYLGRDNLVD